MNIKKYSWLAALPMIFTACQNDALVENQSHDGLIYTLSAQMDGGAAMSRAQIQLNNPNSGEEIFFWNQEDHFNLYQYRDNAWQQHHFTISSDYDGSSTSAEFTTLNAAVESIDFQAFYPSSLYLDNNRIEKSLATYLDFSSSTPEVVWKNYFNNNMFMVAQGNFSEMDSPTVSFNHLCALARVSYTNKSGADKQINGIRLWSYGEQEFGTTYVYNASEGQGNISIKTSWYEVYTNGLTVPAGETTDLYLLFYPTEFADCDMYITIMEPDKEPNVVMPVSDIAAANPNATGFEAGKRYWFKVTETPDQLVWTKNYTDEPQQPTNDYEVYFYNKQLAKSLYYALEPTMPGAVTFDADSVGIMMKSNVDSVTELVFDNYAGGDYVYELGSLSEIDNFVNLTQLTCVNTGLQGSVDLTQNTALTMVNLDANPNLTGLDISTLNNLTDLRYNEANIAMVDIPEAAIPNIQVLHCGRLSDGPSNYAPTYIDSFTSLTNLVCYGQAFALTDATIKAQLVELQCYNCGITELNLEEYPSLGELSCYRNNLTELIIPATSNIFHLNCFGNKLATLDVTPLGDNLGGLFCGLQNIDGNMVLTLTESQKTKWEEAETGWYATSYGVNEYVDLNVR